MALNNLGVQYETLKMPGKCVESYYKSADHKETLAMANLAQKYLDQGFVNNAKELIDKANERAAQTVAEMKLRYDERNKELRELAGKHDTEALQQAVELILNKDYSSS